MITFITTCIFIGIIYLIYKLGKLDIKLDDATIGVDNPYYDNKIDKMPLSKYEEELDKVFDYDSIKTLPLNSISIEEKDETLIDREEKSDEKVE